MLQLIQILITSYAWSRLLKAKEKRKLKINSETNYVLSVLFFNEMHSFRVIIKKSLWSLNNLNPATTTTTIGTYPYIVQNVNFEVCT